MNLFIHTAPWNGATIPLPVCTRGVLSLPAVPLCSTKGSYGATFLTAELSLYYPPPPQRNYPESLMSVRSSAAQFYGACGTDITHEV